MEKNRTSQEYAFFTHLLKLEKEDLRELSNLLKDTTIKQKMMHSDTASYSYFENYLYRAGEEALLLLFDEEGIEMLSQLKKVDFYLRALLLNEKTYVLDTMMKEECFRHLMLQNLHSILKQLDNLSLKSATLLVQEGMLQNIPEKQMIQLITNLSDKVVPSILMNVSLSDSVILSVLDKNSWLDKKELLGLDTKVQSLSSLTFSQFYEILTSRVSLAPHLLTGSFAHKLITMQNVKEYRMVIELLKKDNSVFEIEQKRKLFYEERFQTYDDQTKLVEPYLHLYHVLCQAIDQGKPKESIQSEILLNLKTFGQFERIQKIYQELLSCYQSSLKEKIYLILARESNLFLSNAIIDYHFEDVAFNVFLDLKQMLHFIEQGYSILSKEDIERYQKIVEIDNLSFCEKMKLHNDLKKFSWCSKYYDDFRKTKETCYQQIQNVILNTKTLLPYRNEELSKQANVDVYVLEKVPFYAFIKSFHFTKDRILQKDWFPSKVDSGSYSLDASCKLDTFLHPSYCYNILFEDFPIEQVLHLYPIDSYSHYQRGITEFPSERINQLLTVDELVQKEKYYNEILLAQPNYTQPNQEENQYLKMPKMLAIYCYNTVTEEDIKSAQNLGIGIVVVKVRSYMNNPQIVGEWDEDDDTESLGYQYGLNYITKIEQDDSYGRK